MVKQVHLKTLRDCPDKEYLGEVPKREEFTTIYREDVDVYLPDGTLAVAFRKGVLKSTIPVEKGGLLTPEAYSYWQWVSKALATDQRGMAAGKDIVSNPEIRVTLGQWEFFSKATRAKNPLVNVDEARALIDSDSKPSRNTFYIHRTEEDGLVNLEEIEKWDSICRKKSLPFEERKAAQAKRNTAKLAWFENWFERDWLSATESERPAIAKAARKRLITAQPRSNRCYSNVLGTIDRSGRLPYGRLTASTVRRWDDFVDQKHFYHEVNDLFQQLMPEAYEDLYTRFQKVKDERYNFWGTAFTTWTINNNFDVKYHYDGSNAVNGKAVLFVMEKGDWSGGEFVLPALGLGFDIREGDIWIGDNQGLIHGMLPFEFHSDDAENIMFVAYAKDDLLWMDDLECETCRKDFLEYAITHHPEKAGDKLISKWAGSWAGMWQSPEWVSYKKMRGLSRCGNTNYHGTGHLPDEEILAGSKVEFTATEESYPEVEPKKKRAKSKAN